MEFIGPVPFLDETANFGSEPGGIRNDRVDGRPLIYQRRGYDHQNACCDDARYDRVALIDEVLAAPHLEIAQDLARLDGRKWIVDLEDNIAS